MGKDRDIKNAMSVEMQRLRGLLAEAIEALKESDADPEFVEQLERRAGQHKSKAE